MSGSKGSPNSLLGIEDEPLLQQQETTFQTNKIGGKPDWISVTQPNPRCTLCRRNLPLVAQIYAPLDGSANHRTLYIFGCIGPECFGRAESWICLREEAIDSSAEISKTVSTTKSQGATSWLDDADEWGNDEPMEGENGNSSNNNDSLAEDVSLSVQVEDLSISGDSNANRGAEACTPTLSDSCTADIELDDSDDAPVVVDTPLQPTINLGALKSFTVPEEILNLKDPEFSSFYVNVIDEASVQTNSFVDSRAVELLAEYQQREGVVVKKVPSKAGELENYEKVKPGHGNDLTHKFISRVKLCPEQLLRYSRQPQDTPLVLQPLTGSLPRCSHCEGALVFELQLMPYLSQRLSLLGFPRTHDPIEFSTVILFSCQKSCWTEGSAPRQEYLVVQSDTL